MNGWVVKWRWHGVLTMKVAYTQEELQNLLEEFHSANRETTYGLQIFLFDGYLGEMREVKGAF